MVGVLVPMMVEGGRGDRRLNQPPTARKTSCSYVKPLLKKNSRSRLKSFQVSIQVEGQEEPARPQLLKKGSTTKLVLPWCHQVQQQVQPVGRQSWVSRPSNTFNTSNTSNTSLASLPSDTSLPFTNGFSQFHQEALLEHNIHRARHGVKLLELRMELCCAAQEYAEELAASGQFQHSGDSRFGENLYWAWNSVPGWRPGGGEAVSSWYSEGAVYDYSREPPTDTPAGHFTQLVWSGSSAMGVGLAPDTSRPGKWIVVVKYDPPGNWLGRYRANVLPPVAGAVL